MTPIWSSPPGRLQTGPSRDGASIKTNFQTGCRAGRCTTFGGRTGASTADARGNRPRLINHASAIQTDGEEIYNRWHYLRRCAVPLRPSKDIFTAVLAIRLFDERDATPLCNSRRDQGGERGCLLPSYVILGSGLIRLTHSRTGDAPRAIGGTLPLDRHLIGKIGNRPCRICMVFQCALPPDGGRSTEIAD